jgi:DNA invertase Pin-like site-specific DNA recombinase
MRKQQPSQITTAHLNRRAIVYRRQATPPQTGETSGATSHQAAQARFAVLWGWPESAIQVIDEETGGNGVTMEHRPGYQDLCRQIAQGEVGLVLVCDVSRLTRSAQVWQGFVQLCQQHATLIAVDGVVFDGTDPGENFMQGLRRLLFEYERSLRAAWRRRAQQGQAPTGSSRTV